MLHLRVIEGKLNIGMKRDFNAEASQTQISFASKSLSLPAYSVSPWDTFLKEGVTLGNLPEKENHEKQEVQPERKEGRKEGREGGMKLCDKSLPFLTLFSLFTFSRVNTSRCPLFHCFWADSRYGLRTGEAKNQSSGSSQSQNLSIFPSNWALQLKPRQ